MTVKVSRAKLGQFDAWARARDNLYYGYGEYFEPDPRYSTDCSGLVMSSAAWFKGLNPYQRYGSTESFRLHQQVVYDLGFLPGPGGPEHFFKVGLYHGGGGPNSHTACTINGINWESSGSYGVQYGPPARGWNDPMFDDFWHFDGVLEEEFLSALTPDQQLLVLGAAIQVSQPHSNSGF